MHLLERSDKNSSHWRTQIRKPAWILGFSKLKILVKIPWLTVLTTLGVLAASVISKLIGKLQDEIFDKNINIGPVYELLLFDMFKPHHQLAPHEQISSLETALLRMQKLLARNVPSD